MKRIGIFCFYDRERIVDGYVEFLLQELCSCLSYLVIVINGEINDKGKLILEKYADELYIRENEGLDGGAYKDAVINVLGWRKIQEYDELILCNDTFYGPFVPFESIFNVMENKQADFWGLNYYCNRITNHLQSYFLVFRKKIIHESKIIEYFTEHMNWSKGDKTNNRTGLEIGLFYYLINQGYSFAAYSKSNRFNIYQYGNVCIKEFYVPVLKRKAFSPEYFVRNNILDVLKYLSQSSDYSLDLILSNIRRVYNLNITKEEIEEFDPDRTELARAEYDIAKISDEDIKDIVLAGKYLYVYGLGILSGRISKMIDIYNGKIKGYVISDNQYDIPEYKNGINVYRVSELDNTDNMIIIVALNRNHTQEVAPYLKKFKEVVFLW